MREGHLPTGGHSEKDYQERYSSANHQQHCGEIQAFRQIGAQKRNKEGLDRFDSLNHIRENYLLQGT